MLSGMAERSFSLHANASFNIPGCHPKFAQLLTARLNFRKSAIWRALRG